MKTKERKVSQYKLQAEARKMQADIISDLLAISQSDMFWFRFDLAYEFVDVNCADWKIVRDKILASKLFWAWFINQWQMRDELFINEYDLKEYYLNPSQLTYEDEVTLREWYEDFHLEAMNTDTHLGNNLHNSYGTLIGQFLDNEK